MIDHQKTAYLIQNNQEWRGYRRRLRCKITTRFHISWCHARCICWCNTTSRVVIYKFTMQVVKLFFCLRLPEGSMFKWSQIDWRSTIFNEPSFLSWTRWHMFLVPTTIGCWGEATCCITSFRREASETSNSSAVISSLFSCFCAAARRENSWLICWGVLHSSGWNRSLPPELTYLRKAEEKCSIFVTASIIGA